MHRRTHSLCNFCNALSPDPVDGYEHALPGLHHVEHRALHGRVAGPAHRYSHVVLCLKDVLDPSLDVVHDLRYRTKTSNKLFSLICQTLSPIAGGYQWFGASQPRRNYARLLFCHIYLFGLFIIIFFKKRLHCIIVGLLLTRVTAVPQQTFRLNAV